MHASTLACRDEGRRERVRAKTNLNGLDYLEVSDDPPTLTVYFLGKAPQQLAKDNFKIEGGRRVRDIRIVGAKVYRSRDPELDDSVELTLNRSGDFSTYTLRLVGAREPMDPYYDHLDFTFKVDCPTDLDCKAEEACPPEERAEPEINYLAKDYASFRQLILDRLALVMPEWQERHVPDLGIALVEVLAYVGDHLSYYQDAVATEAYLDTARQRISVRRHARLVDYFMHEGCNARAWVCVLVTESVESLTLDPADVFFVTGLNDVARLEPRVLSRDDLRRVPASLYVAFEPLVADRAQPLKFRSAHNTIRFYTWGERECCLPRGVTSATLLDGWAEPEPQPEQARPEQQPQPPYPPRAAQGKGADAPPEQERQRKLDLNPGDVLIFEEVIGPKTGDPADADPTHRHAVRLTKVEQVKDPLDDTPVVEIEWSPEDALPFPLCLSAMTDAEHGCVYHEGVSVACGNVVLVDHGQTLDPPEDLGEVPTEHTQAECDCEGHPGDVTPIAGRYRPHLAQSPLTFSQLVDFHASAWRAMQQDPRRALPQITLLGRQLLSSPVVETRWEPRFDLLTSGPEDAHFIVEIDNHGIAHIRTGDGELGRKPEAGTTFSAMYRVGSGTAGNVGAETIYQLVYRRHKPDGIDGVRNPLPARGGADLEPISEVKLFAPSAFRKQLRRAITPGDYARLAERHPGVQHAAATVSGTGNWYEVQVAIDPLGGETASAELLQEVERGLYPFRRIGYDLRVAPAHYVSLDIALDVCVKPGYLRGHVKAALLGVFGRRLLPDGRRGFFHPDQVTFGDGIYLSRLVAAAQAVDGVESVHVTRLRRQFERPNRELENGVLPLGPLEVARCDNDPTFPEHGQLELNVIGGR